MRIEVIDFNTTMLGCQRLGGMTDEVNTVACWVGRVYMHHVVGCMRYKISTVECWVRRVYMHHIVGWHDKRGQHGCMLDWMRLYAP